MLILQRILFMLIWDLRQSQNKIHLYMFLERYIGLIAILCFYLEIFLQKVQIYTPHCEIEKLQLINIL